MRYPQRVKLEAFAVAQLSSVIIIKDFGLVLSNIKERSVNLKIGYLPTNV